MFKREQKEQHFVLLQVSQTSFYSHNIVKIGFLSLVILFAISRNTPCHIWENYFLSYSREISWHLYLILAIFPEIRIFEWCHYILKIHVGSLSDTARKVFERKFLTLSEYSFYTFTNKTRYLP